MAINLEPPLYSIAFAIGVLIGWYPTHAYYALKIAHQNEINQAETITAQKGAADKEHKDNQLTQENSHALQNRLTDIDRQFAAALAGVQQTPAPDDLPGIANGQPRHSCAADPDKLSRPDKQLLIGLARQADEQTARLLACQTWLRQHGEAL